MIAAVMDAADELARRALEIRDVNQARYAAASPRPSSRSTRPAGARSFAPRCRSATSTRSTASSTRCTRASAAATPTTSSTTRPPSSSTPRRDDRRGLRSERVRISATLLGSVAAAVGSALLAVVAHSVLGTRGLRVGSHRAARSRRSVPVVIDLRVRKLPNRWVAPIAAGALVQAFAIAYATADPWRVVWPLIVAAIVAAFYITLGLAGMFGLGTRSSSPP